MEKVKLTKEEQNEVIKLAKLQTDAQLSQLEYNKDMANFWYDFQTRKGGGSFKIDFQEMCVWELDHIEAEKFRNRIIKDR